MKFINFIDMLSGKSLGFSKTNYDEANFIDYLHNKLIKTTSGETKKVEKVILSVEEGFSFLEIYVN